MTTVGLFSQDARIYYVDNAFVVIDSPYDEGKPVIIMRRPGLPSKAQWSAIHKILKQIGMRLVGEDKFRDDGLWYHEVEEVNKNGI